MLLLYVYPKMRDMPKDIKAILWDGQKRLRGKLMFGKERIRFKLVDFAETDLVFNLAYREIKEVNYYQLYEMESVGLEIISIENKKNIFIVDNPIEVKKMIETIR